MIILIVSLTKWKIFFQTIVMTITYLEMLMKLFRS